MVDEAGKRSLFDGTPYEPLGSIGEGGMGRVYLVQHREMLRKFVAKVIHAHLVPDRKAVDRFRLESQSLGRLAHRNIVSIEGTGTTSDGRPFIILEYLDGRTLSEEIKKTVISQETAIDYCLQYLSALQAAHDSGVVHRDFKPANIFLITDQDGRTTVKVLDFGLAKVLPDAPTDAPAPLADPTTLGAVVGTPSYMSPEQARGQAVDERGDIYAAAVVFYKTLTGVGPFEHFGQDRQMKAHIWDEPRPPSQVGRKSTDHALDAVVLRALSKDPERRFPTARAFRDAVEQAAGRGAEQAAGRGAGRGAEPRKSERMVTFAQVRTFVLIAFLTATIATFLQLTLLR